MWILCDKESSTHSKDSFGQQNLSWPLRAHGWGRNTMSAWASADGPRVLHLARSRTQHGKDGFGAFEIPVVWSEQLILEAKLLPLFSVEDSLYLGVASPISGRSFNITSSFWLKPSESIPSLNLESCFTILMCPYSPMKTPWLPLHMICIDVYDVYFGFEILWSLHLTFAAFSQQCPEKLVRSCWSLVNFERLYLISCTTCKYVYIYIYIQMGRVTCSTTQIQLFARHLKFYHIN